MKYVMVNFYNFISYNLQIPHSYFSMSDKVIPRKRNRNLLRQYYGVKGSENADQTLDINSEQFDANVYMKQTLGAKRLDELLSKQTTMLKEIRSLDSEMQTLVYENYNKFISATDTIRRMKDDFLKMEAQMEVGYYYSNSNDLITLLFCSKYFHNFQALTNNMSSISEFSHTINTNLSDSRQKITKLSSVHSLLTKLEV